MQMRILRRAISVVLCLAIIFSVAVQGISIVSADSEIDVNLIANGDFEDSDAFSEGYDDVWHIYNSVEQSSDEHHNGRYSGKLTGGNCSFEQNVNGLIVGNTYTVTVWAKRTDSPQSGNAYVGVKNHGGTEIRQAITSADWQELTYQFTYTAQQTNPIRVFAWSDNATGPIYVDDFRIVPSGGIQHAKIENGKIDVEFASDYQGTPAASGFTALYHSDVNPEPKNLELSAISSEEKKISLGFTQIPSLPVDQLITVSLTYNGQTVTLDFEIAADGNAELVTAELSSLTAENGRITAVLTENPTVAPKASDFTFTKSINGGEASALEVINFAYASASKTVTAEFTPIAGDAEADKEVTIKAAYNGTTASDSFVIPMATANIYYVSSSGSDSNDGRSEATPFQTLSKINSIELAPGDRVLFKRGDTFTGTLKPQGSGTEVYPIIISSYGDDNAAMPILKEGSQTWSSKLQKGVDGSGRNTSSTITENGCIYLYNVEYYEISDLELSGTTYDQHQSTNNLDYINVYSSGIRLVNEDAGYLNHFYFDNLVIHGFRGPTTNNGKTSGGINMNVITAVSSNSSSINSRASGSVESTFVDIQVKNCEIYQCGRSGINFLTAWNRRTGSKWSNTDYGTTAYPRIPVYGFKVTNSLFHDIDGDGMIVDNVDNAVIEYNLCYRTSQRIGANFPASVGFFNWNSDNTVFRYNEVYEVGIGTTRYDGTKGLVPPDAQGIEIDALNDKTWVQYNYLHDNGGGAMLWCSHNPIYVSYDGIVRYNIFENNGSTNTLLTMGTEAYGSEFYNNIMYLSGNNCLKNGQINLTDADSLNDPYKIYNNIFVYEGEEKAINNFANAGVDWRSNIFWGITNLPTNDDPNHPNVKIDPQLIDPNSVVTGTVPGELPDLSGYKVSAGSPAINAGVLLDSMSDEKFTGDFFGNMLAGAPDIGIYELTTAPRNPSASDITDSSAVISWEAPENVQNITKYIVKNGDITLGETPADTLTLTVTGLESETDYTLSIYAQYGDGILSDPATVSFTTAAKSDIKYGDVTKDGAITSLDATVVLQYAAGIVDKTDERYDYSAADVSGDGAVTSLDATYILQYAAGLLTNGFPAENN